jgi:endonuclease/exonuclease/phosphatase family metal-dependent hydrolase
MRWPCLLVVAAACGGGEPADPDARPVADGGGPADAIAVDAAYALLPEDLPEPLPDGPVNARLAVYNTALSLTIKYAEAREPHIIDAVRGLDADVVCLQEIWDHFTSVEAFAAAVAADWPYAFWSNIDTGAWGNGVLLLSKHPMYRGRHLRFAANDPNGLIDRIVIGAEVVTPDAHFTALCTHLYQDELDATGIRMAEIAELATWAQAEGWWAGPTVLLGDLNTGPTTSSTSCDPCQEMDTASYPRLLEDWTDANADWDQCTFCRDLALPLQIIGGIEDFPDRRIDHCLVRGLGEAQGIARALLFDQPVDVDDAQAGTVNTLLSDHLGLRCDLAPP